MQNHALTKDKNKQYFKCNMTKKIIYVEGNILIKTPFFSAPNAGAYFLTPPEGAEIIKEDKLKNGTLIIDEKNPQSIFNEYFARGYFTTYYKGAEFLYNTFQDVYNDYCDRIDDVKEVINLKVESNKHQEILNRMYYMSIVASIDTFVSDIIVTKVIESEESFHKYYNSRALPENKKEALIKLYDSNKIGKWEQEIIEYIMRRSYTDVGTIKKILKDLFHVNFKDKDNKMNSHFRNRHLIAHKNGRMKDGKYLTISKSNLSTLVSDSNKFVEGVMFEISKSDTDIQPYH